MNSNELSRAAWQAIVASGVEYVMVGGLAVIVYTLPRSTLDADFVVAAPLTAIDQISAHFPANFHVDPQPQMEMLTGTIRWIVEIEGESFRIEIFHLSQDAHHQELFQKRVSIVLPAFGGPVWIPTAEDLLIQKLRWVRNKDIEDARNIITVQREAIDFSYVESWCARHDTLERLAGVIADIPSGL